MSQKPQKPITLIATIGSSPAVLTEALFALHQKKMWPVTEIDIVTTSHGAEKIRETLFGKKRVWINLCEEMGIDPFSIAFPRVPDIRGVKKSDETELEDIRNSSDDKIMASRIQEIVRKHTQNPDKRVFGLLSGGRKTMSSHLMSAMQLFSRWDDQLFHILVSEPFEVLPEFFYPTKKSVVISRKSITGYVIGEYDARDAVIDLIDIPFIRLRSYLETEMDYSKSYDELIAEADEKLLSQLAYPVFGLHIHLNGSESKVTINGEEHRLSLEPRQLSMLALFVYMNIKNGKPRDVTWKELMKDQDVREALHIFYRTAKEGNYESLPESSRNVNIEELQEKDEWMQYEHWFDRNEKPTKRSFPKNRTILFQKIKEFLSKSPSLSRINIGHILKSTGKGQAVEKTIRVPVPVKNCRITGLHEKDANILNIESEYPEEES